jgi:uncharacterized protein YjeT (DUF2065 family)
MNEINLLTLASSLVATLFGLLIMLLGWLGNKLYDKISSLSEAMGRVEGTLHKRITDIDRRLTAVETRCNMHHEQGV